MIGQIPLVFKPFTNLMESNNYSSTYYILNDSGKL